MKQFDVTNSSLDNGTEFEPLIVLIQETFTGSDLKSISVKNKKTGKKSFSCKAKDIINIEHDWYTKQPSLGNTISGVVIGGMGAAIGSLFGPLGTVAGAGLGYNMGKKPQAINMLFNCPQGSIEIEIDYKYFTTHKVFFDKMVNDTFFEL